MLNQKCQLDCGGNVEIFSFFWWLNRPTFFNQLEIRNSNCYFRNLRYRNNTHVCYCCHQQTCCCKIRSILNVQKYPNFLLKITKFLNNIVNILSWMIDNITSQKADWKCISTFRLLSEFRPLKTTVFRTLLCNHPNFTIQNIFHSNLQAYTSKSYSCCHIIITNLPNNVFWALLMRILC